MNVRDNVPWLVVAIGMLVIGTFSGLTRMGWRFPAITPNLIFQHGPIMITGFLGTLIALERAVALQLRPALLAPVFFALGGFVTVLDISDIGGKSLTILGSLGLVLMFVIILKKHRALHTWIMALGAVFLLGGSIIWASGLAVINFVPWWMAFLILTIAGERLELGRLMAISAGRLRFFLGAVSFFVTGVVLSYFTRDVGLRIMGLGMIALALWHVRFDIARKTIRKPGLTRYIAICMLSGYVWLLIGGVLYLGFGFESGGSFYDAQLHAIFLGFVFAMIFGHAPIIFPAILGRQVHYHWRFYIHLAFLHISLILRLTGDLLLMPGLRRWGGMLNGIALLLFLLNSVTALFLIPAEKN
jgi:hypothetical protein